MSSHLRQTEMERSSGLREFTCQLLQWDTNFFGFNVARLNGNRLTPQGAVEIVQWCRDNQIRCLYFLADPTDMVTVRTAEQAGFHFVDARCTYDYPLSFRRPALTAPAVRPFESGDLPTLQRIAMKGHSLSRFYFDSGFTRAQCDALYSHRMLHSCTGWADTVLVAGFANSPVGYVTCHAQRGGVASIEMMAVDEVFQYADFGRQLISAALDFFRTKSAAGVEISTQGRNAAAQQLLQRCGFTICATELWYHFWPSG